MSTLRPDKGVEGAFDNLFAFGGLGGLPPALKGFALCIKTFIFFFFALCKFYRFSMGVL